jgi:hypothetical protein
MWRRSLRRRVFWRKESKLNYVFENPGWKVTRWRCCPEAQESGSDCDFQFHHALLINPSTLPYFPCPLPVHHCVTCCDLKPSTVIGQGERPATFTVYSHYSNGAFTNCGVIRFKPRTQNCANLQAFVLADFGVHFGHKNAAESEKEERS